MKLIYFSLVFLLFFACKNTNSPETPKSSTVKSKNSTPKKDTLRKSVQLLFATVDQLRLREKPDTKSKVLEKIAEGESMVDLEEQSEKVDRIKLRNEYIESAWVKVKSDKGNIGWVFGGAVSGQRPKEDITLTPYDKCISAYVGHKDWSKYYSCIKNEMETQIKADERYIKSTSTGYQVTLLSGEKKNLVNSDSSTEEPFRQYEYRYYMKRLGFFIFRINRMEGGDYIMMNDKFGYATPIHGLPKLGPDGRKVVVVNADPEARFEYNGIQLLEMSDQGIETLFEEELEGFGPYNPVWVDEKTITFDFLTLESAGKQKQIKARLVEEEEGWRLIVSNR